MPTLAAGIPTGFAASGLFYFLFAIHQPHSSYPFSFPEGTVLHCKSKFQIFDFDINTSQTSESFSACGNVRKQSLPP
jgi:hypothetical protein